MSRACNKFDVAIAGGGPAGSSAAIRLARAGLRVVMIEQKRFPREKLCGEFISPECLDHFEQLGVDLAALGGAPIARTMFYCVSGRALGVPTSWLKGHTSRALGLSRAVMDKALLDRAEHAGVDVREGTTVKQTRRESGAVTGFLTRTADAESFVEATVLIDARGRAKPLIASSSKPKAAAGHVAFKAHLAGVKIEPSTCEMFVYRGGYGGCLPIENGLHNLCFIAPASEVVRLGSDPERFMHTVLMTNRRAAEAFADATVVGEWHAVPIQGLGPREAVPACGLLAIGDAAAFIDPFTGSGILLALESGSVAADAIMRNFPNGAAIETEYKRRYSSSFTNRLLASSLLRYAFKAPILAEIALTLLGSSERMLRRLATSTRSETAAGA